MTIGRTNLIPLDVHLVGVRAFEAPGGRILLELGTVADPDGDVTVTHDPVSFDVTDPKVLRQLALVALEAADAIEKHAEIVAARRAREAAAGR